MTKEQTEIMAIVRIIQIVGNDVFALFQDGKVSKTKLIALIAEEITTAPELRNTILSLAYAILDDTCCTKNSPIRYMFQDIEQAIKEAQNGKD